MNATETFSLDDKKEPRLHIHTRFVEDLGKRIYRKINFPEKFVEDLGKRKCSKFSGEFFISAGTLF